MAVWLITPGGMTASTAIYFVGLVVFQVLGICTHATNHLCVVVTHADTTLVTTILASLPVQQGLRVMVVLP